MKHQIMRFLRLFLGVLGVLCALQVHGYAEIDEDRAILAILGESMSEPYCMKHIAHAIRNRGTLKGVYGVNNPVNKTASGELYQKASKAWHGSASGVSLVGGADHWLTEPELKKKTAQWYKKCKAIERCGSHIYFDCPWGIS